MDQVKHRTFLIWLILLTLQGFVKTAPTNKAAIEVLGDVPPMSGSVDVYNTTDDNGTHQGSHGNHGHGRFQVFHFEFDHVAGPYVIALWVLLGSIAKIGFHLHNKLSKIFPESCLLIVLGIIIGCVLFFSNANQNKYTLDADTFFLFLLPPIVLEAGYFMPSRAFFSNLGTILLFAIVGTMFNTVLIGFSLFGLAEAGVIALNVNFLQCLLFGSLISAVDPVAVLAVFEEIHVNEILYIVVFGESLLNDGISVVLYRMFETYSKMGAASIELVDIFAGMASFFVIAVGGTLIGILFGLLTAFITKFTDHVRVIEPLFIFIMAYLSYLTAEMFHMSGILAIVFCGMTMKQYVEANISKKSHTTVKYFMKMMSSTSETVIFVFLGLSTVVDGHQLNWAFMGFTLIFCLLYRAIGVWMFTALANKFRLLKISKVDQFIMGFGGLRGAIAFSLVILITEDTVPLEVKQTMVTTTIAVVFFTVFLQGISIKPLVDLLRVKKHEKRKPTMNEHINGRFLDHLMAGIEDITGFHSHNYLRDKFEFYNSKYLRNWLMREAPKTREYKMLKVFTNLNINDAMEHLARHGSFSVADIQNGFGAGFATDSSLAKLIRNYSATSLHSENSENSLPAVDSKALLQQSSTCLDMQAVEAHYSKKLADDSKIHHILSDNMFFPRNKMNRSVHQKHLLTEMQNHPPFHHKMRHHLRNVLSSQQKGRRHRHGNGHGHSNGKNKNKKNCLDVPQCKKMSKNVSFADQKLFEEENKQVQPTTVCESDSDEEGGITFIAKDQQANISLEDSLDKTPNTPTAIERSLPWKRNTGRMPISSSASHALPDENRPPATDFPPWVDSIQYSSVVSPQVSLNIPTSAQNRATEDTLASQDLFHQSSDFNDSGSPTSSLRKSDNYSDSGQFSNIKDSPVLHQRQSKLNKQLSADQYDDIDLRQSHNQDNKDSYDEIDVLPWRRIDDDDTEPVTSQKGELGGDLSANDIFHNSNSSNAIMSEADGIRAIKNVRPSEKVSKWIKSHSEQSLDHLTSEELTSYVDMSLPRSRSSTSDNQPDQLAPGSASKLMADGQMETSH